MGKLTSSRATDHGGYRRSRTSSVPSRGVLLPTQCPACGRAGPAPCRACIDAMQRAPSLPAPPALDQLVALLSYAGAGRELVARLKYRNARASVAWLSAGMAALVAADVALVTWAPTTPSRRRDRGFDQAE